MNAQAALALANARYWTNVAPLVRSQLRRWEQLAHRIDNVEDRALALEKLDTEHFNARAGAILATLAPRARRGQAVEAIVAGQVLFDYLDGLTERHSEDPLAEGERLFAAYRATVELDPPHSGEGYLWQLSNATKQAFASLPAANAVAPLAREIAEEAGEAQARMHASAQLGVGQVEDWAKAKAQETDMGWRETLAGKASSVTVVHALVVAACSPGTTPSGARELAKAYLEVCGVLTLMDSLVDREQDEGEGRRGFISFYDSRKELRNGLAALTRSASEHTEALPNGAHHTAMLAGVVAFYSTTEGAESEWAKPVVKAVKDELRPGIGPALAVMRLWRLAKKVR